MTEYFALLGFKVRDIVTGYEGVCETIAFDLYGCVQAIVKPSVQKDKPTEVPDGRYFDVKRLVAVSKAPVMEVPVFVEVAGGSEKPARSEGPAR
jgi:hypothetical protein